jgi:hypothetical protein
MLAGPGRPTVRPRRRGSPRVSSRRNASLVVALGVGALAATSLAAMVATSELLAESFGRPLPGRLEPSAPDLGRPDVIQVEPPERGRGKPPGRRSDAAAAGAPPRRRHAPGSRPEAARAGTHAEAGGGGVVVAAWRPPAREDRVAVPGPALEEPALPPALRPVRPSHPGPEPTRPPRSHEPCPHRPQRDHDRRGPEHRDLHSRDRHRPRHAHGAQRPDRDRSREDHGRCHHGRCHHQFRDHDHRRDAGRHQGRPCHRHRERARR